MGQGWWVGEGRAGTLGCSREPMGSGVGRDGGGWMPVSVGGKWGGGWQASMFTRTNSRTMGGGMELGGWQA